ncbi:hypothetical protein [Rhizobium sp. Root1203]|uniref:hypothetical protein n=1 Tax=Rhizobium sp. Root1203 TaxID=1736427 RepID=UPI000A6074E8|nr:hypothetical protein [Rhizobium sp. Root1203]
MIETIGIVLRIHDIATSQEIIESNLGCPVQWGTMRDGSQSAVVNLNDDRYINWDILTQSVREISGGIAEMIDNGAVGIAKLDIGMPFYFPRNYASSITIPAELCELAGKSSIAIEVTYYATSEDDEVSSKA